MSEIAASPFRPELGAAPPVFVGRGEALAELYADMHNRRIQPPRVAFVFEGVRGMGKTATLRAAGDMAAESGWTVIREHGDAGLIDRLIGTHLPALAAEADPHNWRFWFPTPERAPTYDDPGVHPKMGLHRVQLERLGAVWDEDGTPNLLMYAIDELHRVPRPHLSELIPILQLVWGEVPLGLIATGMPGTLCERIYHESGLSFFARAGRHLMDELDNEATTLALRQPVETAGRTITDDAVRIAFKGSAGNPFLIQLIGDEAWQQAGDAQVIDAPAVRAAVPAAWRRFTDTLHRPMWASLDDQERAFVQAVATCPYEPTIEEIMQALDLDGDRADDLWRRLVDREVVHWRSFDRVQVAVPYMNMFLAGGFDVDPAAPGPESVTGAVTGDSQDQIRATDD